MSLRPAWLCVSFDFFPMAFALKRNVRSEATRDFAGSASVISSNRSTIYFRPDIRSRRTANLRVLKRGRGRYMTRVRLASSTGDERDTGKI